MDENRDEPSAVQHPAAVTRYMQWLETLTALGAHRVSQCVSKDVRYRTPEAETTGREGAAALHAQCFEGASSVRIRVLDVLASAGGPTFYLRWDRVVTPRHGARWSLSGISEVTLDLDGQIMSIIEYWDGYPVPPARGLLARLFKR